MKEIEHERRDWLIVFVILLFGLLCVFLASGWALRFAPRWELETDMGSNLDPNSDYLTRPSGVVEAIDSAIQTQPVWMGFFLTEGAVAPTRIRMTSTPVPFPTSTRVAPTTTKYPTGTPTSTLVYLPFTRTATSNPPFTKIPAGTATGTPSPKATSTSTATATNTLLPASDLAIAKDDFVTTYDWNTPLVYTVTVVNNGPNAVVGALMTDNKPPQIAAWTWTCNQINGAAGCDGIANSTADFSDSVDLPNGASIEYTVTASIVSGETTNLVNSASVDVPANMSDPVPGNNLAVDTDYAIIGNSPDNIIYNIPEGGSLILNVTTVVNGHAGPDLVYYEFINDGTVYLDWVNLEIGDGTNWYPVFYWGDNVADTNTNVDFTKLPPLDPPEPDQRPFDPSELYNSSGVTIDLDSLSIPQGTYPYVRISAPVGDVDHNLEVDAIQPLP